MQIQDVTLKNIDVYDASFNSNGALLYLDAGNSASYSGSGTTWTDLSTNTNNATLVGSPPFTNAGTGSYFSFNGTGSQYATTLSSKYNKTYTGKTVMVAMRIASGAWTNGVDQYRGFFGVASGSRNFNSYIHHDTSNRLQIHYSAAGIGALSNNVSIPANTWVVVAITQTTGGLVSFYLNGELVSTTSGVTFSQWVSSSTENVGITDNFWYGDVGVTAVYGRALIADEILQNYNSLTTRYGL